MDTETLGQLGELRILRILEHVFGSSSRTSIGFGDDVSAVKLGRGRVAVLKTDMLVGSTDVPPGMTMRQTAWKAAVANVSDLAAKGVRPLAGLVSLGLPAHLRKSDIGQIARGLQDAAKRYGFPFVGGDTNESQDLAISIALFAVAKLNRLVLRSGAKDGDLIAVTGGFGATAAGLKALMEFKEKPETLNPALYDAVFCPRAQLETGVKLAASGALTSSTDSSDGLAWSLHELSAASRLGMLIRKVPVGREVFRFAELHELDPTDLALYGGEEYHLVVTVRPSKIHSAVRATRGRLRAIGVVTSRFRGVRMLRDGGEVAIERRGWEHFVDRRTE